VLIALTGTPGVGKTATAMELLHRGRTLVDLGELARERGLLGDHDLERDTYEVDPISLGEQLEVMREEDIVIVEGHLSHLLPVDLIIVLRCSPALLEERLRSRGWSEGKIRENMEAEACDVILIEALDSDVEVCEVDTTCLDPGQVADAVEGIIRGEREKYTPGHIDWSEEVLGWY
jgi:adenylate kinase